MQKESGILFVLVFVFAVFSAHSTYGGVPGAAAPHADSLEWHDRFGEQLVLLLNAPREKAREEAMMLILDVERVTDAPINYEPVVPHLFRIYERDVREGNRMLALAALHAIGTPHVMERLAERVPHQVSVRVRRQTVRVLSARAERMKALP